MSRPEPHVRRSRRDLAGVVAALAATATLLLLPAPRRAAVQTPVPSLTSVWPQAKPQLLPRTLPDGSSYEPRMILDAATSVGLRTSIDAAGVDLVLLAAADPATPRVLVADALRTGVVIDALAATPEQLFWLASRPETPEGGASATLWAADRAGGRPRIVTTDTGRIAVTSSQYDLRAAGGRLSWMATAQINPVRSELRSVAATGGPVTVAGLDGPYTPTAWPWLVSDPGLPGAPVTLLDPTTGRRRTVTAGATQRLACSPAWCRIVAPGRQHDTVTLLRPDGSDRRQVAGDGALPATVDVAMADRFAVLARQLPGVRTTSSEALTVVDLATGSRVPIAVVTSRTCRDGWLWWSGDPETDPDWHLLHLAALP